MNCCKTKINIAPEPWNLGSVDEKFDWNTLTADMKMDLIKPVVALVQSDNPFFCLGRQGYPKFGQLCRRRDHVHFSSAYHRVDPGRKVDDDMIQTKILIVVLSYLMPILPGLNPLH